ncbi:broad specificity phosphatase PhoE [Roseibium hamelinense]|uniref:Broad specificity phosphatase PhoE n=1 Tax=Roseibium hamelinense TaxID=150831 RepID=A0A562T0Y5_9HYPH|nr:histidine phosphatase family protein [Roseibium hamelinense]MTI44638.1 histidine phosphatase family protein [Roseibium hamelinense]TWI87265.1 broad specificity phosphatase PhoE [Roseibium hamelinense]
MSFCIYLTHPEVNIDEAVPVPEWGLSEVGRERAAKFLDLPFARDIKRVISSAEKKAVDTAHAIADPLKIPVLTLQPLHENDRSATGYLPPEEFDKVADEFFSDPYTSVRGWERAFDAQMRIVSGVQAALVRIPPDTPILFAGHGGVGTLLMCHLMNTPISREHDQKRAGSWFQFDRKDLTEKAASKLSWTEL